MKRYILVPVLAVLFLTRCGMKPAVRPVTPEPIIRVGLIQGAQNIVFSMERNMEISDGDRTFIVRGMQGGRWEARVEGGQPGKTLYRLVAASMSTASNAEAKASELKRQGFETVVQPVEHVRFPGDSGDGSRKYRVLLDTTFTDRDSAVLYKESISGRLETFITEQPVSLSTGTLFLKNPETGQEFESRGPVLLKGGAVTVYGVSEGQGYHWEQSADRRYPETVSFQLDREGRLMLIAILPLEKYLEGVVPSEMPVSFPQEALRAQAVAARSEALTRIGTAHPNEPFDVCATVHCQVYTGLSKTASSSSQAVKHTRGMVLWAEDRICNAVYSSVCGGHGEDNDKTWGGDPKPYLRGRYDGAGLEKYGSLSDEARVRRWIQDFPGASCNTATVRIPDYLEYTRKYFRWNVTLTQDELQSSLSRALGWKQGKVLDLVPLERGVSGRILTLKVAGEKGQTVIQGELAIRKALSPTTLWSACFIVDKNGLSGNAPGSFTLSGAGWGHGVGMCQTGAAMMALQGKHFYQILEFYFPGTRIRKLY